MKTILLSLSAKQVHKTLAPWCLKSYTEANGWQSPITIIEMTANDLWQNVVAAVMAQQPDLLGISCYIWNIDMVRSVGAAIRLLAPRMTIILGGPEVSFETDLSNFPFADAIISGPGEELFLALLQNHGKPASPILRAQKHIPFAGLPSPYTDAYFASFEGKTFQTQLIYYESTRGCPFRCAYCLSSLSGGVEALPLERVFSDLSAFARRGSRCVKFVDRTFNADKRRAFAILSFVKDLETDCVFHFEAAPDLFDEALLTLLESMPVGRVQIEMGIQSVNSQTLLACSRKTDVPKALSAIARLSKANNVHTHVDLIAGLPHETLDTFKTAVNLCLAARPHALQLGFLKLLKGSSLRHDAEKYGMVYLDQAPYEALATHTLCYDDMQKLKAIEDVLDKYYNSGLFTRAVRFGMERLSADPFTFFERFAAYLGDTGRPKTSLKEAYRLLLDFLLSLGGGEEAKHFVKWDVLSHDPKGILPEGLSHLRDPATEMVWFQKNARVRIERFAFDGSVRVFDLNRQHPVTKEFIELQ